MLNVAQIRNRMGITQKEFAKRVGVTPLAIANWEKGATPRDRHIKSIIELAHSHNVRVGDEKLPSDELLELKKELKDMLYKTEMAVLTLNNISIKLKNYLD